MRLLRSSPAQANGLQAVCHIQQQPQQAYRECRHQQAEVKGIVQQHQGHPQEGAGDVHRVIGLVSRLADLLLLCFVTAGQPLFIEVHIVDTALFFRVHTAYLVHDLLLGHRQQRNGEHKNRHADEG